MSPELQNGRNDVIRARQQGLLQRAARGDRMLRRRQAADPSQCPGRALDDLGHDLGPEGGESRSPPRRSGAGRSCATDSMIGRMSSG